MQKNTTLFNWVVRLMFCLIYAVSMTLAFKSMIISNVSSLLVSFCTILATTVFYSLYSIKTAGKIFGIVVCSVFGLGIVGIIVAWLTGALPLGEFYYDIIDIMAGYKQIDESITATIIYAVSLIVSLLTVLLIGRRIVFVAVSAAAILCFSGAAFTGNLMNDKPFLVLVYLTVVIGIYYAFERFIEVRKGVGFDVKRMVPVGVSLVVCAVVALTTVIFPFEGAYTKYFSLEQLSRNVFVKNGEGSFFLAWAGIGTNDDYLGGPITPTFEEVLELTSDEPLYIAGNYKNQYTGYSWNITDVQKIKYEPENVAVNTRLQYNALKKAGVDIKENNVKLKVLDMRFRTLFQSNLLIEMPKPRRRTIFIDSNTNMYTNEYMKKGFKYDFSSYAYDYKQVYEYLASDQYTGEFKGTSKVFLPEYKEFSDLVYKNYTALPETLPVRVKELSQQIVDGAQATGRVQQIEALLAYLYQFPYTLNAPETPEGRDFVDYFLFDVQSGYCTYFASALAVMARTLGIPTRYVEGIAQQKEAGEKVIIDQTSAHAWVEVFFDGFGWVTFEPTPYNAEYVYGISMEDYKPKPPEEEIPIDDPDDPTSSTPGEETDDPTSSENPDDVPPVGQDNPNTPNKKPSLGEQPVYQAPSGFTITVQDILNVLFALLGIAVIIAIPLLIIKWRKRQMRKMQTYENRLFVFCCWKEMLRLLRFDGQSLEMGETLHDFLVRMSEEYGDEIIAHSADSFDKVLYSSEFVTDNDRAYAAAAYDLLNNAILAKNKKWWFNLNRYLLHRF